MLRYYSVDYSPIDEIAQSLNQLRMMGLGVF